MYSAKVMKSFSLLKFVFKRTFRHQCKLILTELHGREIRNLIRFDFVRAEKHMKSNQFTDIVSVSGICADDNYFFVCANFAFVHI